MTAVSTAKKTLGTRATQLCALLAATALLWGVTQVAPNFHEASGLIASVGFLLLAGMLASEEPGGLDRIE